MVLHRYHCDLCGKTYIGVKLNGGMSCACSTPRILPGVVYVPDTRYLQTYQQSCGASTLMCAAIELGVQQLPANPNWILWNSTQTMDNTPSKKLEVILYSVTSGENKVPSRISGYSLPSNITKVARHLGLDVTVHLPTSNTAKLLTTFYPGEVTAATSAGATLVRTQAPVLLATQRRLRIVRVGAADAWLPATALHYLLERSDGSIMDPALGKNYTNFAELERLQRTMANTLYIDTQVTITLEAS